MDVFTLIFRLINVAVFGFFFPLLQVGCLLIDGIGNLIPWLLNSLFHLPIVVAFQDNIKKLQPYILTLCVMIVLVSTIINLRFDEVKHVVKRTFNIALMSLLIPIIISQGIDLTSKVTNNVHNLLGERSLATQLTNTIIYENPSWNEYNANNCKGGNASIILGFPARHTYYTGYFWNVNDSTDPNYVQSANLIFAPTVENVHSMWKAVGLDPSNLKNVFPNDDGEPFPGTSGGIATEQDTLPRLALKYLTTGCAIGTGASHAALDGDDTDSDQDGKGVIMKWDMVNIPTMIFICLLVFIVGGMIFFKVLEQCYEALMLGIFLPLTNMFRVSELGVNIFKSHLTQFGLALAEIPLTIIVAEIGISFMLFIFKHIDQLINVLVNKISLTGNSMVDNLTLSLQDFYHKLPHQTQSIAVPSIYLIKVIFYIIVLIWAIKIIGKGPQRLSKVFESNFGTSSTMSGIVGSIAQTVAQTAFGVAMYRSGGIGGMPKGSPEGDIPDRPDSGVSSGLEESSTGGGSVDAYSSANRSTDSVSGDIAPTIDDANQTATRNTNVIDTTTATHNGADSPYAGMTNEQRTSYVNNNVVQTNNVTSNNVASGNSTLDSRPSFNPDDYNGAK